jgi:hypothetical protein
LSDDFKVVEEKGVKSIRWKGFEGLLIPKKDFDESKWHGIFAVNETGLQIGAGKESEWKGDSVFIIRESGQTAPYEVWSKKKEIEYGLHMSGVETNISDVYLVKHVDGAMGVSIRATVVPYARTEKWICPDCGRTIEPNIPHFHGPTTKGGTTS